MVPRSLVLLFLASSLLSTALFAQAPVGSISGTVTDESGAVIQNATVTITDKATGSARTVTANAEGLFSAPSLPVGQYRVHAELTGFRALERDAHICCLLGTVCTAGLLAAWFQKWLVHRRTRPEEFGGSVQQTKTGAAAYPIHNDLINSAALKAVFAANRNYLLPQAYPEGCPLHPSYPQGHGTVAGACSAMLKAFFDETQILTNCVVASADGTALTPYSDTALTVGGEINKLAFNVAMGRNFAGIHYRSAAEAGIRLGEDVAIAMLQDYVSTFAETFTGFSFTRVDGTPVQILP